MQETQVPIIEDTTLHDLALERDPPPPLAAYAPDAPILTVGSLSKLFWGGLRIGWIRAPESTIAQLAQLKLLADLGSSIPSQLIGAQLLERTAEIRAARAELLRERARLLGALLAEHLPSWSFARPMGGTCLWTRLPHGDAGELARIAARHRVTIVSGATASVSGSFTDHVRLPYVNEPDVLEEGVRRLSRAWYEYERSAPGQPTKLGMVI
jgi:DNA-binding transcriptional MocR family regulator